VCGGTSEAILPQALGLKLIPFPNRIQELPTNRVQTLVGLKDRACQKSMRVISNFVFKDRGHFQPPSGRNPIALFLF